MYCRTCGKNNDRDDGYCWNCGSELKARTVSIPHRSGTRPTEDFPDSIPLTSGCDGLSSQELMPFVDGDALIIPSGAILPPICVKCGRAADKYLEVMFRWFDPTLYLLLLLGAIRGWMILIVVGMVIIAYSTKRKRLRIPLCSMHRHRREFEVKGMWLTLIAAPLLGTLIGIVAGTDLGYFAGVCVCVVPFLFFYRLRYLLPTDMIDRAGVHLLDVNKTMLNQVRNLIHESASSGD